MPPSDVIETIVAEVTAELLRQGVGPDEAVSIIIDRSRGRPVILKIKWRRILNIIWRKLGYGNPRRRQSQPAQP